MNLFKEWTEESMWIPDGDFGHYEFQWYGLGFKDKPHQMPLWHRLKIAWRILKHGRIDSGKRATAPKADTLKKDRND